MTSLATLLKPYVSPMNRAREILANGSGRGTARASRASTGVRCRAKRLLRLEPVVASALEKEEAPWRVMVWVAWGRSLSLRQARTDLALHLRHSYETRCGGWLDPSALDAALAAWQREIEQARAAGLVQPQAADVPLTTYAAAIAEARPRRRRRRRHASAPPPPIQITAADAAVLEHAHEIMRRLGRRAGLVLVAGAGSDT